MKKHLGKVLLVASFLALLDQFTKYLVERYLVSDYEIIPGLFKLEYAQNFGIAFGIKLPFALLIALNAVMLAVILRIIFKDFQIEKKPTQLIAALIIGGALGNLLDRFVRGYVVDFIAVYIWPNFNLADIYISVGVLLLLLFYGKIKR